MKLDGHDLKVGDVVELITTTTKQVKVKYPSYLDDGGFDWEALDGGERGTFNSKSSEKSSTTAKFVHSKRTPGYYQSCYGNLYHYDGVTLHSIERLTGWVVRPLRYFESYKLKKLVSEK